MKKILLIEDDIQVSSFIVRGLVEEGYLVEAVTDGASGLSKALANKYHLVILDIMLPGLNGFSVCTEIRKSQQKIPILFLSALGNTENVVLGLDAGADDYLPKPFKFVELLARIRTLLRRTESLHSASTEIENIYAYSDLVLNDDSKTISRAGKEIQLTSTEYRLMLILMKNPLKVLSRVDILDDVWGGDIHLGTNVVDVYVNYLRKKLEFEGLPRLIQTVVGMGYVLKESNEDTA